MIKEQKTQGIALMGAVVAVVVIAIIGAAGFFVMQKSDKNEKSGTDSQTSTSVSVVKSDAKIKHLGIDIGYYDPVTNKAGDIQFTKDPLQFKRLFMEYGFTVPANSVGPAKKNPQPTFIVPLKTKVHALVDGEVVDVPKLYSGDYSIMMQSSGSEFIFETEHVINVKVKKGDKVKAGDVIAEVSDYDAKNYNGMGLFEIGILKGSKDANTPPSHVCPFAYLDESIKDETLKKISALQKSWEEYVGDTGVYNEAAETIPGCAINDPIEG
jgi:biotin carboxyl carrier protein